MPIPTPHKGEKEDDFMKRCMHEASSSPDRTNDQNVAICKDAWRKGPAKEEANTLSTVYPNPFYKMNTFKTLAEARGAYDTLAAQLAEAQEKTAAMADLEVQLAEAKSSNGILETQNRGMKTTIEQQDSELSILKSENAVLKSEISGLKDAIAGLEKTQKTAKLHARELVAASGGAPIAVDQAEIARMQAGDEKEFVARMAKEMDPHKLAQLYKEYNNLFRSNSNK